MCRQSKKGTRADSKGNSAGSLAPSLLPPPPQNPLNPLAPSHLLPTQAALSRAVHRLGKASSSSSSSSSSGSSGSSSGGRPAQPNWQADAAASAADVLAHALCVLGPRAAPWASALVHTHLLAAVPEARGVVLPAGCAVDGLALCSTWEVRARCLGLRGGSGRGGKGVGWGGLGVWPQGCRPGTCEVQKGYREGYRRGIGV